MLTHPTLDTLKRMKLTGMVKALEEQLGTSDFDTYSFEDRLGLLVDRELTERENRSLKRRLTQAKLRQQACIEDLDYSSHRGLNRSLITSLSSGRWIKEGENMIITGPAGVGKSYLSCALVHRACLLGYKAVYYRASKLFGDLQLARADGRYAKLMSTIAKTHLIVIDDWGLNELTEQSRTDCLDILEDRQGLHSTIFASQLPVDHWHKLIGNPTIADAILDRIVHSAHTIKLAGESMRKKKKRSMT